MPIGWDGDEDDVKLGLGKEVGEAVRQTALVSICTERGSFCPLNDLTITFSMQLLLRTWRQVFMPGLLAKGFEEQVVDEWLNRAEEEINDPAFKIYLYLDYTWAVRSTSPD